MKATVILSRKLANKRTSKGIINITTKADIIVLSWSSKHSLGEIDSFKTVRAFSHPASTKRRRLGVSPCTDYWTELQQWMRASGNTLIEHPLLGFGKAWGSITHECLEWVWDSVKISMHLMSLQQIIRTGYNFQWYKRKQRPWLHVTKKNYAKWHTSQRFLYYAKRQSVLCWRK